MRALRGVRVLHSLRSKRLSNKDDPHRGGDVA